MDFSWKEEIEIDGRPWYVGHSREYVRAVVSKTDAHRVNDLVTVKQLLLSEITFWKQKKCKLIYYLIYEKKCSENVFLYFIWNYIKIKGKSY